MVNRRTSMVTWQKNKKFNFRVFVEATFEFPHTVLPPFLDTWHSWSYYVYQCILLSLNILNYVLEKIMKIWYFENTHRDKSNDILYDIISVCILVEKYEIKITHFQIGHLLRDGGSISQSTETIMVKREKKRKSILKKNTH